MAAANFGHSSRRYRAIPFIDIVCRERETDFMASPSSTNVADADAWRGRRVVVVGRLAGAAKREARRHLKSRGAELVDDWDASVDVVVVGEHDLPPADLAQRIAERTKPDGPPPRVVSESEFWHELGAAEPEQQVHRLYTPAMLADLLGVSAAVIRRWHRRGLITPVREVRRLPYFDFAEVSTARRLAEMLAGGASPKTIERQLSDLRRLLPGVERPLTQLSVIVEGRDLLLRQGDGLLEAGGQYRFDFDSLDAEPAPTLAFQLPADDDSAAIADDADASPEDLVQLATEFEDRGRLDDAADLYRAALAAGGPNAEYCFQLADVLYRLGDVGAARERYLAAIEIDEDYVEARANLGCILAEQGRLDLAIAAFQGALRFHETYPDVHYHLARVLDEAGRPDEAELHWRTFVEIMPESPWAENARRRLGLQPGAVEDAEDVDD
jgi:tetratricopeptide (TPR) repeat protein